MGPFPRRIRTPTGKAPLAAPECTIQFDLSLGFIEREEQGVSLEARVFRGQRIAIRSYEIDGEVIVDVPYLVRNRIGDVRMVHRRESPGPAAFLDNGGRSAAN